MINETKASAAIINSFTALLNKILLASLLAATVAFTANSTVGQCVAPSFDTGILVEAGGAGPGGEIATGDLNGDGRMDILEKDGWWEQPKSLAGDPVWKQHKVPFAAANDLKS